MLWDSQWRQLFLGLPPLTPFFAPWQEPFAESGATGLVAMMQVGCGNDDRSGNFSSDPKPFPRAGLLATTLKGIVSLVRREFRTPQKWPKEFRFSGIYFNKKCPE